MRDGEQAGAGAAKSAAARREPVQRPCRGRRRSRRAGGSGALAFAVSAAAPLALALVGGGADLLGRQELAIAVWALLFLGFLFGQLPRTRPPRGTGIVLAAASCLIAWTALGLLWTDSVERTVAELARLLLYAGVGTMALTSLHSENWRAAAWGLLAAGAAVCVVALASRVAAGFDVWGPRATLGGERLNYPLDYWNALAFVAAATLVMAVGLATASREATGKRLALAAGPLAGLTLYLTYSRGGLMAAAVGVFVLVLASAKRRAPLRRLMVVGAATGLLILVTSSQPEIANGSGGEGGAVVAFGALLAAVGAAVLAPPSRGRRSARPARRGGWQPRGRAALVAAAALAVAGGIGLATFSGTDQRAATDRGPAPVTVGDPATRLASVSSPRWELWAAALAGFADAPLAGHGAGTYAYQWDASGRDDFRVEDSHSLLMDALVELGLPGTVALLVLLGAPLWLAIRGLRGAARRGELAALVAAYAAFCAQASIDWLWEIPLTAILAIVLVSTALAARSRPRRSTGLGGWGTALACAACLAAIAVQVPGIEARDRINASQDAQAAGQERLSVELASDAVAAARWFASPYAQRAEAELARGRTPAAARDSAEAARREPLDWRHPLQQARIALAAGRRGAAVRALARVARLRPASRPLVLSLQEAIRAGSRSALDAFALMP